MRVSAILDLLRAAPPARVLEPDRALAWAGALSELAGVPDIHPRSLAVSGERLFCLAGSPRANGRLIVLSEQPVSGLEGEERECELGSARARLRVCPWSAAAADLLREALDFLRPRTLGCAASFGFGDRLGLATPGHARACARFDLAPVFAQQSIREMARTGRSPQEVMDDALFGVLRQGFDAGFGADADHLKETADVERCFAAGFTLFTFDPSDHVEAAADRMDPAALEQRAAALPWDALETSLAESLARCEGASLDGRAMGRERVLRVLVKVGRALARVASMARHLEGLARDAGRQVEIEISMDEADSATAADEHFLVASELRRLGVEWIGLAPRFEGRFEKGVDYIGELATFERCLAGHARVARELGPYKLSLHSGSDKLSIYAALARGTGGAFHVKTAGTSWLEALRVLAAERPGLFREILALARERYAADRRTYHVSARLEKVPGPDALDEAGLPALLDDFDARQVLHVTFGSVVERFSTRLLEALAGCEQSYLSALDAHFARHLAPLAKRGGET
ncbi:MAG: hypothetical protein JXR96_13375 [Deltaproteobacteria bacterium]|nr:hypothetical protein [Deltaproteobacteria bacterium]